MKERGADKSAVMFVWRILNLIMCVFFLLAISVNLNDPDWFLWCPIYLVPVLLAAPLVVNPLLIETQWWNMACVVHFTLCAAYSLYQVVLLFEAIGNRLENPLQHEVGRELGGLWIILAWLGLGRFTNLGRPEGSVSNRSMMSALLLMTVTLTILPLFVWSLCFISDWHTRLGHCTGMF